MNTIARAIDPLIDSAPPDLSQLLEWKWAGIKDNFNQIKALSTTSKLVYQYSLGHNLYVVWTIVICTCV